MIKDRQLMLDQNKAMLERLASQDKIIKQLSKLHLIVFSDGPNCIMGIYNNKRFLQVIKYIDTPRAYITIDGVQIPLKMIDNIKGIK